MSAMRIIQLVVVLVYVAGMWLIAEASKKQTKSLQDFIRPKLGAWTVAFTGFATAFSTSLLVVGASTSYQYGAVAQWIGVPQALGIAVMFLLFSLPLNEMSDKLNSLTISEFLGNRYKSDAIRALSALVLFVFCIGHLIVIYRGMGLAIAEIMHVPYWLAVVLSGFLAALYTAYGGQIAVARTDLVQGWIMTIGMIVLIPVAIYRAGGFNAIHSGLAAISPQLVETPGNYPMGIFLGLVVVFSLGMLGQPQLIYRAMFIEKKKDIPKIAILAFIFSLIACWISYYSGSVGRVLIPETLTNPDSTMPIMITMLFNPIVATVLMTAMCAAAMSTTDSILIMAATAVSRDIYQKLINNKASDKDIQKLTRRLTLLLGAVGAIWALKPPSWFIYLMAFVWGVWAATYLFPILYGLYWRGVTKQGALIGMILAPCVTVIWKIAGDPFNLHSIFPGLLVSALTIPIVSMFTPKFSTEFLDSIFTSNKKKVVN